MIALDVADLVVIAGRTLGIGTDAALSRLDPAAARAALAEADSQSAVVADQDAAAQAGIRLMHALLRHRPFPVDGEQIAVAAGLQFLSLNGWQAELGPPAAAAVVVEALGCGQLSLASAAAWLSPRLTADTRLSAWGGTVRGFRLPLPSAARRKPASVLYPQVLLFVQAGCWALAAVAGLSAYIAALGNGEPPELAFLQLAGPAVAGGLVAAKVILGLRVGRTRSRRTRRAIITTELIMTCFGLLWLFIPAYGFIMLGLFGALLSLAAVVCMNRPRARQYFAGPDAIPGTPDPGGLPGPASFWQPKLTSHGLAVIWPSALLEPIV
jgi:hypothetical protein